MIETRTFNGNGRTIQITDPQNVSPEECLEIAKCGAEAWNSWQELTPTPNKITFPKTTQISAEINFSNFKFQSEILLDGVTFNSIDNCCFENTTFNTLVDFKNCTFKKQTNFTGISLDRGAVSFRESTFEDCFNGSDNKGARLPEFTNTTFMKAATFKNLNAGEIYINNSKFIGATEFSNSTFTELSNFQNCIFSEECIFSNVTFKHHALFHETTFKKGADFSGSRFFANAYFPNSSFGGTANFTYVQFGEFVNFHKADFSGEADFRLSQFISVDPLPDDRNNKSINFSGAHFRNDALFSISSWSMLRPIYKEHYDERKAWADKRGVSSDEFATIDFSGSIFNGRTSFQGRKFKGSTNFGQLKIDIDGKTEIRNTEFTSAPNFHECEFHQNTSFYEAEFPKPIGDDSTARAYRTLKLAFSKKQDLRQEQKFFNLEMEEELKSEKKLSIKVAYRLFRFLGRFGFSIKRPIALMLLTTLFAMFAHGYSADLEFCNPKNEDCNTFGTLIQFTLFSLPGFEKLAIDASEKLFPKGMNICVTATLVIHKTSILLGLFLLGLALRNQFKMK